MSALIEHWRKHLGMNTIDDIHPEDHKFIHQNYKTASFKSFENYFANHFWESNTILQTDALKPVPYVGNIQDAKLFILMLNPGFTATDYFSEIHSKEFVSALEKNLRQEKLDPEYPFIYLDPRFIWHGGAKYWYKKFKPFVMGKSGGDKLKAIEYTKRIAQKTAVLELFPYHSKSFKSTKKIFQMPSTKTMLSFYQNELFPRALKGEIRIIIARGARMWNFLNEKKEYIDTSNNSNIFEMNRGQARSASLSNNTCKEFLNWTVFENE